MPDIAETQVGQEAGGKFGLFYRSINTGSLAENDSIDFDLALGDYTISTGQFTILGGEKVTVMAGLLFNASDDATLIKVQLYDVTNSTLVNNESFGIPQVDRGPTSIQCPAGGFATILEPTSDTVYELRVSDISTGTVNNVEKGSWLLVTRINS